MNGHLHLTGVHKKPPTSFHYRIDLNKNVLKIFFKNDVRRLYLLLYRILKDRTIVHLLLFFM